MAIPALRIVLDTNVLLSGLVSDPSASQRVIDAHKARRAIPLLSPPVLAEYRAVLLHRSIRERFPGLTPERVALALARLRYVADEYREIQVRFEFPRDPRDAMFIELAIAADATHIVTLDPDMLSLPTSRSPAARRFRQRLPGIAVLRPAALLERSGPALGLI